MSKETIFKNGVFKYCLKGFISSVYKAILVSVIVLIVIKSMGHFNFIFNPEELPSFFHMFLLVIILVLISPFTLTRLAQSETMKIYKEIKKEIMGKIKYYKDNDSVSIYDYAFKIQTATNIIMFKEMLTEDEEFQYFLKNTDNARSVFDELVMLGRNIISGIINYE